MVDVKQKEVVGRRTREVDSTCTEGVRIDITAGKHSLELECPPLGRSARVPLAVKAGVHLSVVVDFNQDPPEVRLR